MVTHVARRSVRQSGGILAKVPERNVGSQLFLRQCGFRAVKILPAYLLDDEDVYVMEYSPPEWALPMFEFGDPEDGLIPAWGVKHGCW